MQPQATQTPAPAPQTPPTFAAMMIRAQQRFLQAARATAPRRPVLAAG